MSSCCGESSQKNAVTFGVMLLLLASAVVVVMREAGKPTPVETVEIVVATKDMTTGTAFTKDNVGNFTEARTFPKSQINPEAKLIRTREELIGKRLTRATHAGEFINAADVNSKTPFLDPGKDIMSLPMLTKTLEEAKVGPRTRVDLLACFGEGEKRETFLLLADREVLAIGDQGCRLSKEDEPPSDRIAVHFAVDEAEMKLISQANLANCTLELVVQHPNSARPDWSYATALARVNALLKRSQTDWAVAPPPREVGKR